MILLFNHLPVTEAGKISKLMEKVLAAYGSEFYNVQGTLWKGDDLTVESLFPSWIVKRYNQDPENVLVVTIIKNYLRWLFSLEYGYGAQLDWENLRSPISVNEKFLQGIAESYFPGADFSDDSLSDSLENIRSFSIKVQKLYFDVKGTPQGIKHALINLLGYSRTTTKVFTTSSGTVTIKANILDKHKPFIEEHLIPAGVIPVYESV
jgi:hypothetical protein